LMAVCSTRAVGVFRSLASQSRYVASRKTMSVADKFKEYEVVPDVVSKAPQQLVEVKYGNVQVNLGNNLTPTQVKDAPTQIRWNAEPNSLYTLVFTDPDAPSRETPTVREFQHWLVANIPGNKVESGETWGEYIGSGPPQGTGLHRYVFLVYKQPGKIQAEHGPIDKYTRDGRPKWRAEQFASKHSLEGPIAGNFYQAEYDDYVPNVHAQLKPK